MDYSQPLAYCPGCRGWLGQATEHGQPGQAHGPAVCPYCALPLTGEEHAELRQIDAELAGLEQRCAALHGRRQALLSGLRTAAQGAAPGASAPGGPPAGAFGPMPTHDPVARAWAAGQGETSSYTARNVLLLLGGALLTVAALAFTLLRWGDMGVGGRAAVLGGLTLCTLAAPLPLLRRKLAATAESIAGFGLVLLALDAYALRQVAFPYVDGLGYTASMAALIAALWAGYGLALPAPGLRLTLPFAVAVAQLPLPLWALTLDVPPGQTAYGLAVALLLTFAADVALAASRQRDGRVARATARAVRLTAAVAAVPVGALMTGVTLSQQQSDGVVTAVSWSALQLLAATTLLYAGWRHEVRRLSVPLGTAAGLVLITAFGGAAWAVARAGGTAGWDWRVLAYLLCAMGLLGALLVPRVARTPRAGQLDGLVMAALVVQCGALVWVLVPVAEAVFGPWSFVARAWEGPPNGPVWQAVDTRYAWTGSVATPLILLLLAASVSLLTGIARGGRQPGGKSELRRLTAVRSPVPALPALTALCAAAGATAALSLPYWPAVAVVTALVVVLFAAASSVADTGTGVTALVSGLVLSVTASGWALAHQATTLVVLALMCSASAATAVRFPKGGPGRRAALASSAVGYAAGLAGASAAALHFSAHHAAFAVLAVAVGTVPAAALLARGAAAAVPAARKVVSLAVECAGCVTALVALMLCAPHPDSLWLALALCAVSAAGAALRSDRRPGAGYASAVLLVLATWVRLFVSGISTPEAYTLPVSAALLLIGWLRRRRLGGDGAAPTRVSSWWAYGGGLTFTFLPSLFMVASDPHWLRPLLLGAGALGTTLAGARRRAQAPLLLGGATLAAVGVHELAPYVIQVAWLLPRWLVPALAGLLLVVAGATYERRLEEARRLKRAWQRLS